MRKMAADDQYRDVLSEMWELYTTRGSEWWPRFSRATAASGGPDAVGAGAAATTAWFDLLRQADRPALDLVSLVRPLAEAVRPGTASAAGRRRGAGIRTIRRCSHRSPKAPRLTELSGILLTRC